MIFYQEIFLKKLNIEVLSTTEDPLDDLEAHKKIIESKSGLKIISTYRPDNVINPESKNFINNIIRLGEITNEDITTYNGYLNAHFKRRQFFKSLGTTSTDHGHPTANTFSLSSKEISTIYDLALLEN